MARRPFAAGAANPSANQNRVETIGDYLERLASSDPVPGGGSAAALTAAVAAALTAMVGRFQAPSSDEIVARADGLRRDLCEARRRDEAAYAAVVAAQALPRRDDAERATRRDALAASLYEAAEAPLHAATLALSVLELTGRLTETPMRALASDVGSAAELAAAAVAACAYNVRVNHRYMHDEPAIRREAAALDRVEREASQILARVRAKLKD
jgi:formiminotetrahydrofolate cyclodeaminase